ncbi:MAG: type II toxin-antitoxin system HicA family toxin [Candidatus Eisenbacteria bacterium]|nr:type II toxin-antitoxin system HicA family toxin [Candidatus Eisenbacteria bacterium]
MPKIGHFPGTDVCRILKQHGFRQVRQRGSHVVMQRKDGASTVTVPVPIHCEIRIGTLLSIIRQSGVQRTAFEI